MSDFLVEDLLTGIGAEAKPTPYLRTVQSICYLEIGCSDELALIRLLLGGLRISVVATGHSFEQQLNYSILGHPTSFATRPELERHLSAVGIDVSILNRHLRTNLRQSKFYEDLCGEVLHFFFRSEALQHTVAFLHLYRLLERLSFPLPLIYAARSKDFKSAYNDLKLYFEGKDKGELGFFKKFSESALDTHLLDATTTIDFSPCRTENRPKFFAIVKRFVEGKDIVSESADVEIEVRNRALLSLLVNLRNRYFHATSGNAENISMSDMSDSDELFSTLNTALMNWLAAIYFEVLRHNLAATP